CGDPRGTSYVELSVTALPSGRAMKRAPSRCSLSRRSLSTRAALLVVLCSLPASADVVPTTPDPQTIAYAELWLARTFDSNIHDPAGSSQSANPTDEGSLRYLHG